MLLLAACSLPIRIGLPAAPSATPVPTGTATPIPPTPILPLGSKENPIVLALPPTARPQGTILDAGETLTSLLRERTGYEFAAVIPPTEVELIEAFGSGNAHVASLSPFAYLMASDAGDAEAAFAREQDGEIFYGAEFIAPGDLEYLSYFDPVSEENLSDAEHALSQLNNKKPCWTDRTSASGYVVPLGILRQAGISTREPAFLAGHPAVVRALYAGGICDFGATYVGAIDYPGLEDELPDVTERIAVIWRIPRIIPYETMVYSTRMPVEMRRLITRTLVDLMGTPEGKSAIQTLYGYSAMQIVTDGQYVEFRDAVHASGLDTRGLVQP